MRIEKIIYTFIKSYYLNELEYWKVSIPDGQGGQIRKQGFINKTDALNFADKKYSDILKNKKGLRSLVTNITVKDYSQQWLVFKERTSGARAATLMRYKQELNKRIIPFFGHFKLVDIEKHHLRNFISDLQNVNVSNGVIQYTVTIFKSLMKQAEIDDLVFPKGISLVQVPKHKLKPPKFWDSKEINYFLNATKNHTLHDLWKLTLYTGLRAGEIAGLQWDAIYFDKKLGNHIGFIEVKRTYNQKTRSMQETTKNGDKRNIPVLPEAREVLERLYKKKTGNFVFGNDCNLESSHFNRQLKNVLEKLPNRQIPVISFHGLRHSFCSYLDSTGLNRRIVSEIMGHRDLNTTNRYSHVSNQTMGNEVQKWMQGQNQQKTNNLEVAGY